MKINNDKYYTSIPLANYCMDQFLSVVDIDSISEVIEPSVGDGAFLHHDILPIHFACDVEPECTSEILPHIITGDFLVQDIKYLEGRVIIGNPPYGRCLNLAQKFFKKSIEIADYIGFILPISQLNNTNSFFEFDLIHSIDLGEQQYSDRTLHCCFNVYRRPLSGELNSKPKNKLKSIKICRQDSSSYDTFSYDVRMCYWGNGSAGKILSENEKYSGEYKIKIDIEDEELCREVKDFILTYDWNGYVKAIAMKRLKQYHLIEVLAKQFPMLR
jgi:hypothetical protein